MSERFVLNEMKSSWEKYFVEVDASAWLGEETIVAVSFAAKDAAGNGVTDTLLDPAKNTYSASTIKPYIQGGVSGTRYYVLLRVESSGGNFREFVIELLVQDA